MELGGSKFDGGSKFEVQGSLFDVQDLKFNGSTCSASIPTSNFEPGTSNINNPIIIAKFVT